MAYGDMAYGFFSCPRARDSLMRWLLELEQAGERRCPNPTKRRRWRIIPTNTFAFTKSKDPPGLLFFAPEVFFILICFVKMKGGA